jgi:hypothetical protein
MALQRENQIGQQILNKVDQLIDIIYNAGMQEAGLEDPLFDQGCLVVRELFGLLEQIIGPRVEYMYEAVQELIKQRLPDQRLLNEFGDFFEMLDQMLNHARISHQPLCQGAPVLEPCAPELRDDLSKALSLLFPSERIIRNFRLQGVILAYYMPSQKLAVDNGDANKDDEKVRREYLCRYQGITLLTVNTQECSGYRDICRIIRRKLPKYFQKGC